MSVVRARGYGGGRAVNKEMREQELEYNRATRRIKNKARKKGGPTKVKRKLESHPIDDVTAEYLAMFKQ